MRIYIVRHGETQENHQQRLQGHLPGHLTELGKEQVRQAAEKLALTGEKFSCIVSSDLQRALDSASIIANRLQLPMSNTPELRERNLGECNGMSIASAREKYFYADAWHFPESAETEAQIFERACKILAYFKEKYFQQNIIVVTHGLFAKNMMAAFYHKPVSEIPLMNNAEFHLLEFN